MRNPIYRKLANLMLSFTSLLFLLLSGMLAIQEGLQIDWWSFEDLVRICTIVSVFATITYYNRRLTVIGIVLGTVFEAGLAIWRYELIEQEFLKCYYHVIPLINNYYRTNYETKHYYYSEDSRILLLFVVVILGLWIGEGVTRRKKQWLFLFPLIPALGCGFFLGYAPGISAFFCLIVGLSIRLLIRREKESHAEQRARGMGFICVCIAVGISGLFYQSVSEKLLSRHTELKAFQLAIEDKMLAFIENQDWISQLRWRIGGQQNYASLTNEAPDLSNQEVFTITLENRPVQPIYVKNFTGEYYEEGVWYPAPEEEFKDFASEQYVVSAEQYVDVEMLGAKLQTKWYDYISPGRRGEVLTIEVKKRTGGLSLLPYFTNLPEGAVIVEDNGIRMEDKQYQMHYCAPISIDTEYRYGNALDDYGYEGFISEKYTEVPDELENMIRANINEVWDTLFFDATYSFDLEPVPEGRDIIEYFLLGQKKGYCMHFASAYTLMYRTMGAPTRYVSGYMVPPADFKLNEDGTYTAVVTEQRAHAWAEHYDLKVGWYPVEVTPASYYEGIIYGNENESVEELVERLEAENQESNMEEQEEKEEPKEPEKQPNKEPVEQTPEEEKSKEENTSANGQGQANGTTAVIGQAVLKVVGILLALTMVILLAIWRRKFLWQRRERQFTDADTRKGAKALIRETFRLLKLSQIELMDHEDEMAFAKATEAALECLEPGEFTRYIEIARIARYGNAELTGEQVHYLRRIYGRLIDYQRNRLKWYQKLWYSCIQIKI